jgi:hypothetical protein
MVPIFESRYNFSTGYSRVKPYPPKRSIACDAIFCAARDAKS